MERAFLRYKDVVRRFAASILDEPSLAEDVTQEVFLKLCRSDRVFSSEAHLKNWLLKVAGNQCRNINRGNRRHLQAEFGDEARDYLDRIAHLSHAEHERQSEEAAVLAEHVRQLPAALREAIFLRYVEGYGITDIARISGVTAATVSVRLHRGRQKLKTIIRAAREEETPVETQFRNLSKPNADSIHGSRTGSAHSGPAQG